MKKLFILLALLANQVFANEENTKEIQTRINEVTVFLRGAQVTRTGEIKLLPGRQVLLLKSLSPYIDSRSIQVKSTGDFTILSVNHNLNYLDELDNDKKVDSLITITKTIEGEIDMHQSRLNVLSEKLSLLNANKKLGNESSHISINDLKQAVDFYDQVLMEIKGEELKLKDAIQENRKELEWHRHQIGELQGAKRKPTGQIRISVEVNKNTTAKLSVNYLVDNAGWNPKYDLRVKDVESPLQLTYKADLYQNTGVNWENVKLKFSNGNPNQSGVAPRLHTWYLNYLRNTRYQSAAQSTAMNYNSQVKTVSGRITDEEGNGMPGVNVVIKGSSIGTVTDVDGYYSITIPNDADELVLSSIGYTSQEVAISGSQMDIQLTPDITALNEVVVVGYGGSGRPSAPSRLSTYKKPVVAKSIITTTIENQTTVEFEVEKPYSIKSNAKNLTVKLNNYEIETVYEYYAVPKLDKDAFLIARIVNWDQFNLLEGEANLYFEDAYVGRSVLDAKALTDTLEISLGRDKNIVISRENVNAFTKRTSLGANKVDARGFKITARNKKSQSIHLTLLDQIPVSTLSSIEITPNNISKGTLDKESGEVKWVLDLSAQSQTQLDLEYEVKYPKREKVILE